MRKHFCPKKSLMHSRFYWIHLAETVHREHELNPSFNITNDWLIPLYWKQCISPVNKKKKKKYTLVSYQTFSIGKLVRQTLEGKERDPVYQTSGLCLYLMHLANQSSSFSVIPKIWQRKMSFKVPRGKSYPLDWISPKKVAIVFACSVWQSYSLWKDKSEQ